jgi:hypothetical protein
MGIDTGKGKVIGDAVRHGYVSGRIAMDLSPGVANLLGLLNELTNPRALGTPDAKMDFHNNAVGRELARQSKSKEEFEIRVWGAIVSGEFKVFDEGNKDSLRDTNAGDVGAKSWDGLDDKFKGGDTISADPVMGDPGKYEA